MFVLNVLKNNGDRINYVAATQSRLVPLMKEAEAAGNPFRFKNWRKDRIIRAEPPADMIDWRRARPQETFLLR